MTDYQKKKIIDLVLVTVGIVLVGLFLRTQLSNPIILQVDEAPAEILGPYVMGSEVEDEENLDIPEFVDIRKVSVVIDRDYIDLLLTLRGIPETLPLGGNQYSWSIAFDVNGDGETYDDVTITHQYQEASNTVVKEAPIDDEDTFVSTIVSIDKEAKNVLGSGEAVVDGNVLYIRIPNSSKLGIDATTPFKISVSCHQDQLSYEDKMPSYSGE